MTAKKTRRDFLAWATAGTAACATTVEPFPLLPRVSRADAVLPSNAVSLAPEIEPIVRLIEQTDRDRLLETIGQKIRQGVSYQQVLAGLMLAGVRNVQPRPHVGFKFHAVLVVNSAHLASLASPSEHRWLPIFWALDYFKSSQAADRQENNWTMRQPDEAAIPSASKARQAFISAMDNWDEPAADAAASAVARHLPANAAYELFFRYGARDYRSIGHKAIFVANSWRTLQCIGWRHAEPVIRSLTYALLKHDGSNPAKGDAEADLPWRENEARAKQLRPDWLDGKLDSAATQHTLAALRTATHGEAAELVVKQINAGVAPQSIWDAYFLTAAELLVRQPAIIAMHAMTSTNALRFAYRTTASDDTRRMLLLQTGSFLTLFRKSMAGRGKIANHQLDTLQPYASEEPQDHSTATIFKDVSHDKMRAATRVLSYLKAGESPQKLLDQARLLMFFKGSGSHDYKFGAAAMEDYYQISPAWRDRYLAAAVFNLRGSDDRQNRLVARAQSALS